MTYVQYDTDNSIIAFADWPVPGMVEVDYEVVRGYDGKLYKADEAPVKPQEKVEEEAFVALRMERNQLLADTDYLLMVDYPIDAENLESVKTYRQALRDLPEQEGAPWVDGEIPWPKKPEIVDEEYQPLLLKRK